MAETGLAGSRRNPRLRAAPPQTGPAPGEPTRVVASLAGSGRRRLCPAALWPTRSPGRSPPNAGTFALLPRWPCCPLCPPRRGLSRTAEVYLLGAL